MKKTRILLLLLALTASTIVWAQSQSAVEVRAETNKIVENKVVPDRTDSSKQVEVHSKSEKRKVDAEQLKTILEATKGYHSGLTASLAVVIPFVMIILLVLIVQYYRYKRKRDLYLLITKFVESGREVPLDLLIEPKIKRSDLRRGLVFLGFGLAIIIAGLNSNKALALIGLIPLLLGVAYLTAHFLIKSKDDN